MKFRSEYCNSTSRKRVIIPARSTEWSESSLRSAVRKYQDDNGLTPDGDADLSLLKRIDAAR